MSFAGAILAPGAFACGAFRQRSSTRLAASVRRATQFAQYLPSIAYPCRAPKMQGRFRRLRRSSAERFCRQGAQSVPQVAGPCEGAFSQAPRSLRFARADRICNLCTAAQESHIPNLPAGPCAAATRQTPRLRFRRRRSARVRLDFDCDLSSDIIRDGFRSRLLGPIAWRLFAHHFIVPFRALKTETIGSIAGKRFFAFSW